MIAITPSGGTSPIWVDFSGASASCTFRDSLMSHRNLIVAVFVLGSVCITSRSDGREVAAASTASVEPDAAPEKPQATPAPFKLAPPAPPLPPPVEVSPPQPPPPVPPPPSLSPPALPQLPPPPPPALPATDDLWPERYVDRPQTLLRRMGALSLTVRQYFAGPAGYDRRLTRADYGYGITDRFQIGVSLPRITCQGHGDGRCIDYFKPLDEISAGASYAVLRSRPSGLKVGGFYERSNFGAQAGLSTRLKLVVPHLFSLEIEPDLNIGLGERFSRAWWSPGAIQDANQSRVYLTFDFNLQGTSWLLLWADAIPYLPTAQLSNPGQTALELFVGVSARVTAWFEASAQCGTFNALTARHWEYVPDVWICSGTLRFYFLPARFGSS
ncbi:MAG: hypothetical protein QOI66_2036 [Myxococcales bacterium]|jgi:hypothetical protein|nr:hypothetical protein [Myxococcales bacterium]